MMLNMAAENEKQNQPRTWHNKTENKTSKQKKPTSKTQRQAINSPLKKKKTPCQSTPIQCYSKDKLSTTRYFFFLSLWVAIYDLHHRSTPLFPGPDATHKTTTAFTDSVLSDSSTQCTCTLINTMYFHTDQHNVGYFHIDQHNVFSHWST